MTFPSDHSEELCSAERALAECLRLAEAQWEYGCRARTETPWWTGKATACLHGFTAHAPVGRYRANALGIHDVIGNVWEWCLDDLESHGVAANVGEGQREGSASQYRVYRGGSFSNLGVRQTRAIDR